MVSRPAPPSHDAPCLRPRRLPSAISARFRSFRRSRHPPRLPSAGCRELTKGDEEATLRLQGWPHRSVGHGSGAMNPRYTFTPAIVRDLMEIEAARQAVQLTVLPPAVAEALRQSAWLRATHYSTRIEGNRLTLAEAEQAVMEGRRFPGRERDVREVQNYYRALQQVEAWAEGGAPISEAWKRSMSPTWPRIMQRCRPIHTTTTTRAAPRLTSRAGWPIFWTRWRRLSAALRPRCAAMPAELRHLDRRRTRSTRKDCVRHVGSRVVLNANVNHGIPARAACLLGTPASSPALVRQRSPICSSQAFGGLH